MQRRTTIVLVANRRQEPGSETLEESVQKPANLRATPGDRSFYCQHRHTWQKSWLLAGTGTVQPTCRTNCISVKNAGRQGNRTSYDTTRMPYRHTGSTIVILLSGRSLVHHSNRPRSIEVAITDVRCIREAFSMNDTIVGVRVSHSLSC